MVSYKGNRSGFNDPSDMPPATARASSVTLNAVVLPEALMPATPMAVLMLYVACGAVEHVRVSGFPYGVDGVQVHPAFMVFV